MRARGKRVAWCSIHEEPVLGMYKLGCKGKEGEGVVEKKVRV